MKKSHVVKSTQANRPTKIKQVDRFVMYAFVSEYNENPKHNTKQQFCGNTNKNV